ncbi:MAG TPA: cell division protein ZapA [Nevskia sp.]|nr:cell division protein ZapA [Nevskia sp.]
MSNAPDKTDMKPEPLTVTVRIMAREYTVTCPAEEHEGLVASADYLNERMTAIRRRGKALGAERIAVMTALNLARELLTLKGNPALVRPDQDSIDKITQMSADIDQTLNQAD